MMQYPFNTDNLIDYYKQISQSFIRMFFDTIKLQQDYLNAFQPQLVDHMRANVENYLAFQDKLILLYIQNYNLCLKNVFDSIIKEQAKDNETTR